MPSDDVIVLYFWSYCQVTIYWVLRDQIIISPITSPKSIFRNLNVVSDSARMGLSIEPIKIWGLCKKALELITSMIDVT